MLHLVCHCIVATEQYPERLSNWAALNWCTWSTVCYIVWCLLHPWWCRGWLCIGRCLQSKHLQLKTIPRLSQRDIEEARERERCRDLRTPVEKKDDIPIQVISDSKACIQKLISSKEHDASMLHLVSHCIWRLSNTQNAFLPRQLSIDARKARRAT